MEDKDEKESKVSEPTKLPMLDPDHPILERFQKTLKEHLLHQIELAKNELSTLESEEKKLATSLDELGVNTYEAQQLVCKQEKLLEQLIDQLQTTNTKRTELEKELEDDFNKLKEEKEKYFFAQKSETELQNDIESTDNLLQQMIEWEKKMESNITVNQRISEKTRKDNLRLAEEKRFQDMIIFNLRTKIWKLEKEMSSLDIQIKIKEKEEDELAQIVATGNTNIEALQSEYRCLMHSWNSVLVAIGNRDKVLECLNNENQTLVEQIKRTSAEICQINKLIKKEMRQNEQLTVFKMQCDGDIRNTKQLLDDQMANSEEIQLKIADKQSILIQLNWDIDQKKFENKTKAAKLITIQAEHDKIASKKRAIEEEMVQVLEYHTTNNKAAQNLLAILKKLRDNNKYLEINVYEAENKQQQRLFNIEKGKQESKEDEQRLNELETRLVQLEADIKKLELEISHDESTIRSKERLVEMLNMKLEKATSGPKAISPQQLKINALEKHSDDLQENIKKLQAYWLREQKNLLVVSRDRQEQICVSNILKRQLSLLTQKNQGINLEINRIQEQLRKINRNILKLQNRSDVLCGSLYAKKNHKTDLDFKTTSLQLETNNKLKDAEMDCLKIEDDIQALEEDKINLSKELLELSREVLEWDKKVIMMRETHANLRQDHSKGGELEGMRQEIHRMTVRYSQLKRAQERLLKDLENCVSRRDSIYIQVESKKARSKEVEQRIRYNINRKVDDVRNKIKQIENDIKKTEEQIEVQKSEREHLKQEVERTNLETVHMEQSVSKLNSEIEANKTNRELNFELLMLNQKKLTMYSDLSKGRTPYTIYKGQAVLTSEYNKQKETNGKLMKIVENLLTDFPNYHDELTRICNTLQLSALMTFT